MLKINYDSYYKNVANQTLDWLPMDTKELYEKNLKEKYKLLKTNDWIDKSFTYKFNSYGFRCEEFTNESTIMFLGCSHTQGIGLPSECVWPELVSNNLNMHCANFGIGGGSLDTAFRLCHGWIKKINPKIVMLLEPPGIRFELAHSNKTSNLSPFLGHDDVIYESFAKDWSSNETNNYLNSLKNILAIESLCSIEGVKFIKIDINELYNFQIVNNDYARDLTHCGKKTHQDFAKHMLTKL